MIKESEYRNTDITGYVYEEYDSSGVRGQFRLNMRILADVIERAQVMIEYYGNRDFCRLTAVRAYLKDVEPEEEFVYILSEEDAPEALAKYPQISFVVNGRVDAQILADVSSVILILEPMDTMVLYGELQEVFERYRRWCWELQTAIEQPNPLDAILEASHIIFRNPLVIHDANFFILADPNHTPVMSDWERDPRTGREMVSVATINDFRADVEYLEGLKVRKPVMFSSNQTGYRILFRNLWNGSHYEGRILLDEVENPIQPGDYFALEYLGETVERYVRQKKIVWLSMGNDIEEFFSAFLEEGEVEERQALAYMQYMGWKRNDSYYCMRIVTEQKEFNLLSSEAILGQIDLTLPDCVSFYYNNSITVIVNVSCGEDSIADMISKLAIIIRDGLLKVGVSAQVQDFYSLPKAYQQAMIALDYGLLGGSTYWYYYFNNYILEYILDCAGQEMPIELLSSDALRRLKQYDEENKAELYRTLEVYLRLEKNVLRTSKELFIHRSTLAYRLERIQKIIDVDLENPKERLKLLLSYYMEGEMREYRRHRKKHK